VLLTITDTAGGKAKTCGAPAAAPGTIGVDHDGACFSGHMARGLAFEVLSIMSMTWDLR
jgi:hypothetical protein